MYTGNQYTNAAIPIAIHEIYHDHEMFEITVERAKKLFLDGWIVSLGLSGKDSGAASVCVVEGLKRAMEINPQVGPLYIVTTDTTLDNMVLHGYMMQLHKDLREYGKQEGLPIFTKELKPSITSHPMVEYVGRGKLLRTAQTSSNGRDCAVDWKIMPMKRFLNSLEETYQTTKIVSISGSRDEESAIRAANLKKRGETATEMTMTGLGWSQPVIKDWTLNDVWKLFSIIDDGDIESYSDNFDDMRKHYSAGNGGTCDLFASGGVKNKECGARFGCVLCAMNPNDESLEAQINTAPKTYGFMKPLNDLRTYMINTLYDYNNRSLLGREMKDGYIKVGINQYSIEYRMNLLRYVLTIQNEEYCHTGNNNIDLIDYEQIVAIQYHWSREGGEPEPGMAFKIWNEIMERDEGHYPIPETTMVEKTVNPTYMYFPLEEYVDWCDNTGLNDEILFGEHKDLARVYRRNGEIHQVIRYHESKSFEVVTKDGFAADFVTSFYPTSVEEGDYEGKCPTVMLKQLLESGVVRISKGSIARLNNDAKRAQTLNALSTTTGIPAEHAILQLAIPKRIMEKRVAESKANLTNEVQTSFF